MNDNKKFYSLLLIAILLILYLGFKANSLSLKNEEIRNSIKEKEKILVEKNRYFNRQLNNEILLLGEKMDFLFNKKVSPKREKKKLVILPDVNYCKPYFYDVVEIMLPIARKYSGKLNSYLVFQVEDSTLLKPLSNKKFKDFNIIIDEKQNIRKKYEIVGENVVVCLLNKNDRCIFTFIPVRGEENYTYKKVKVIEHILSNSGYLYN